MTALAAAHGLDIGGRELALLCQKVGGGGRRGARAVCAASAAPSAVIDRPRAHCAHRRRAPRQAENLVVGAPCGVMDQMAAACGGAGQLLALLCQPAEVVGNVPIPQQVGMCVCRVCVQRKRGRR